MTHMLLPLLAFWLLAGAPTFSIGAETGARPDALAEASGGERPWLPTLITDSPEEGFELAIVLARKGVTTTQPDIEVLRGLRPRYAHDPDSLTAASHVVAVYFQTIAAANDYWRAE